MFPLVFEFISHNYNYGSYLYHKLKIGTIIKMIRIIRVIGFIFIIGYSFC